MTNNLNPSAYTADLAVIRAWNAGLSPSKLMLLVLGHRRWFIAYFIAILALILVLAAITGRSWTSSGAFVPHARRSAGGISALAAQIGMNVGAADLAQGPLFYAEILRSNRILGAAVDSTYVVATDSGVVTSSLPNWFGITEKHPGKRRDNAIRELQDALQVTQN